NALRKHLKRHHHNFTQCPDSTSSVEGVSPMWAGAGSKVTARRGSLDNSFSDVSGMATVTDPLAGSGGSTATGNGLSPLGRVHSCATLPGGTVTGCSTFTVSCLPWRREL